MKVQITDAIVAAQTASLRRQHRSRRHSLRWRTFIPYFFLSPAILLFLLFFVLPFGYAVWQSLFRIQRDGLGLSAPTQVFSGLANYQKVFVDSVFYQGIERVLVYGLIETPILLGLALLLALILDGAAMRLRSFFRISFFLPYAIPSIVATLLWGYLYDPQLSPITQGLSIFHLGTPNFQSSELATWLIGNIAIWSGTGYQVLLLFSALQAISPSLYEAALLDGCSGWQIAWYIKVPLIVPALVLTGILTIVGALQLITEPLLLTNVLTSINSAYTPNMYLYQVATSGGDYFYAAALSVTLALVTFVFSFSVLRLIRRQAGV